MTLYVTYNRHDSYRNINKVFAIPLLRRPINLDGANSAPRGICGDSETYWVANKTLTSAPTTRFMPTTAPTAPVIPARTSTRSAPRGTSIIGGIWCDGQTMYVVDWSDLKIFAYKMVDDPGTTDINEFAQHDSAKDFDLYWRQMQPKGIWGNDSTIWVSNDSGDKMIFAYRITDDPNTDENEYGSYDSVQDFTTLTAARNWDPQGIWSNGTTMYVVDDEDEKVYAYRLSDKARDPSRDIPLASTNQDAYGAWSYGDTLYVTDTAGKVVHSYPLQHPATGKPNISGIPQAYQRTVTAEASASNFTDTNGISTRVRFSYQWIRSDGGVDTDIEDATERTYMPVLEDEGKRLKVRVRFRDNEGYEERHTSTASATVLPRPANIRATGQPSISGTEQEKQTLTGRVDGISDGNGIPADVEYSYQWIRSDGGVDTEIAGAIERTYKPVQEDVGKELKVRGELLRQAFL